MISQAETLTIEDLNVKFARALINRCDSINVPKVSSKGVNIQTSERQTQKVQEWIFQKILE